ncbi:MAG TPA: zinc ribbon domain-containing protein [Caldithrix sp.]|nr:zinc ribbon domain-containing protein [Caldithrix sp.]
MPTYEYICKTCGYKFEEFQSMSAEPLKVCPKCNNEIVRKIGTGAGLVFKGSGFYITDYKNKKTSVDKNKPAATKEKKSSPDTKKAS